MNILPTLNMQAYVIACSLQITKDLSAQLWSLFETFQPQCAHSAWLEDPSGTRKRTETPATQRDLPKQGSARYTSSVNDEHIRWKLINPNAPGKYAKKVHKVSGPPIYSKQPVWPAHQRSTASGNLHEVAYKQCSEAW